MEGVGLVTGFQFCTRLAAVFAEEVGCFEVAFALGGQIKRCSPTLALCIHMRAIGDKQFDDFLATFKSRLMQRSPSLITLRIYIHASGQVLFDGFDVSFSDSLPYRNVRCFYFGLRWFCLYSFDNGFSRFPFSFQFFTRLATMFAEEFGGFGSFESDGKI